MMNEMMKMMKNMIEKVDSFDERRKKIESMTIVSRSDDAKPPASSFANIAKSGVPKSAVVVKPKQKQLS